MSPSDATFRWSRQFGLATAPLFDGTDSAPGGEHNVLLDGGNGTFALSISDEDLWRENNTAAWAWSSDIPHHVTLTSKKVGVVRWDIPSEPQIFERSSVENNLDRFYKYLNDDRLRSNNNVVNHLLGFFRRIRALSHEAKLPDAKTTDVFSTILASLIGPNDFARHPAAYGLSEESLALYERLDGSGVATAINEALQASGSLATLSLYPSLAIRHAGGQLFQEAHFELLRGGPGFDLFGLIGVPEVKPISRGGTHFTPPALARSIVEQVFYAVPDIANRRNLVICDPACGSGAFLHEAFRALRKMHFQGQVRLVGYDISEAAIAMAKFVIASAVRDWSPKGGVSVEFKVGDSLGDLGIPDADIIVMNPPFIGFGAQTPEQREQLRAATNSNSARGDYSMAFIVRALKALKKNGVLGTLFPSSLLSLKAAESWREQLLDLGQIRLLGSIGDFGLFSHAMVQVGCAIIQKSINQSYSELVAMTTDNNPNATSLALRQLRKLAGAVPGTAISEEGWTVFPVPSLSLRKRPTWRLPAPKTEQVLRLLDEALLPTVSDLFTVAQGVQTGLNDALLLTYDEWRSLPTKERRFFRLATMSDSIQNGQIVKPYQVFFPHLASGPMFHDAQEVRLAAPIYYSKYLLPYQDRLSRRASIVKSQRLDWWGLMRARDWAFDKRPRIISKFFSAAGGFAADYDAKYVPVMGHLWMPKFAITKPDSDSLPMADLIAAYTALLNSSIFIKLIALYAPHVAGGQYDVSSRHVAPIPIPNLRELSIEPGRSSLVAELANNGRLIDLTQSMWRVRTNQLVMDLYGTRSLAEL